MPKGKHFILEFDDVKKTGICKHCGPVKLVKGNQSGERFNWRCYNGYREATAKYYAANRDKMYAKKITSYGLRNEDVQELKKNRVCAICRSSEGLVIDHDHRSGDLRGVLCSNCNRAIGLLKDNQEFLQNAYNYLITPGFKYNVA